MSDFIKLLIDGQEAQVECGCTVFQAAEKLGVEIPLLCSENGCGDGGSCMVCAVKNLKNGQFIPSCEAKVQNGMEIDASSDEVKSFRKDVLELLLAEHRGDCVPPCELVCPKGLPVAAILHLVAAGNMSEAASLIPGDHDCGDCVRCEKACRRGRVDRAVAIANVVKKTLNFKQQTLNVKQEETVGEKYLASNGEAETHHSSVKTQNSSDEANHSYNHRFGKVSESELKEFLKECDVVDALDEVALEAARCLHCDCRAADNCRLRDVAAEFGAVQSQVSLDEKISFEKIFAGKLVFELSKCIKCGRCIKVAEVAGHQNGPIFCKRGYDMVIGPPIGVSWKEAVEGIEELLAAKCPTGAFCLTVGE